MDVSVLDKFLALLEGVLDVIVLFVKWIFSHPIISIGTIITLLIIKTLWKHKSTINTVLDSQTSRILNDIRKAKEQEYQTKKSKIEKDNTEKDNKEYEK